MFAQLASEYAVPTTIGPWLECLAWFAGFVFLVLKIVGHFNKAEPEKLPQPLQVQYAQRLATFDELEALRGDFDEFKVDQKEALKTLREDAIVGRRRLHDRIEEIPQKVIRLLIDTKGLNQ